MEVSTMVNKILELEPATNIEDAIHVIEVFLEIKSDLEDAVENSSVDTKDEHELLNILKSKNNRNLKRQAIEKVNRILETYQICAEYLKLYGGLFI